MEQKKSEFNKVLNAWDVLVIAFGAMIGWGWVVSTGGWIEKGGVLGAAIGFVIGGIMIFFVGMTYAELTAAMPQCGGEHVFSYKAMGSTGSFICTWMIILGYVSVACFEACAFPTIITYLWPGFLKGYLYTVAGFDIYASWLIVAIVVAFLIMMINIIGAKTAAILQTVLTCIIGGAGILLIIASVINGTVDNLDGQMFAGSSAGLNVKAIIGVAALSPFYFIGFDVIPQAAEEINVPAKKIGSILILSVVLAVVFYALVIVAVGLVMGPQAIVDSEQATGLVTADAMAAAFNTKIMAKVIIVGGMCGIVTSWNSFLLGGSRAMYSMAESYMIPKFFAKLHPKHKTPINSLILIGVLTMLAPFAGRKMLVWISDAGNFGCCVAYCMVALSFIILRKKKPDMPRPYKVPAYKFFGTMAVIMSGFMVAMYCIPGSGGTLIVQEWGIVLAWCALGVVFFVFCKKKYKESFGTLVELISDEDAATLMPEADEVELDKVIDAAIDRVLAKKASRQAHRTIQMSSVSLQEQQMAQTHTASRRTHTASRQTHIISLYPSRKVGMHMDSHQTRQAAQTDMSIIRAVHMVMQIRVHTIRIQMPRVHTIRIQMPRVHTTRTHMIRAHLISQLTDRRSMASSQTDRVATIRPHTDRQHTISHSMELIHTTSRQRTAMALV